MKAGQTQRIIDFSQRARACRKTVWPAKKLLLLTLPLLVLCGCCSFNRDWKKAAQQPLPTHSIEGRWEGKWLSDVNGHTGRLRCLLSRETDSRYQARFRATYWKVFRFGYTVSLQFEQREGDWYFTGDEDLGKLAGGVYHYEGQAAPTNLFSTYRSKYDHGTFQLRRPE